MDFIKIHTAFIRVSLIESIYAKASPTIGTTSNAHVSVVEVTFPNKNQPLQIQLPGVWTGSNSALANASTIIENELNKHELQLHTNR